MSHGCFRKYPIAMSMRYRSGILITLSLLFLVVGIIFWAYSSYTQPFRKGNDIVRVEISEGEDIVSIANNLEEKELIGSQWVFLFGVWLDGLGGTFQAGTYDLSHSLSPADIAMVFSQGEARSRDIWVTFPEGWTAKKMAERLSEKGFDGKGFLDIVQNPSDEIVSIFSFLQDRKKENSLEGYLFPDTYSFFPSATPQEIVEKMLQNFDRRVSESMRTEVGNRKLSDVIIMASIIENEVRILQDRKLVSGIFWKRIDEGIRLQSDATLAYALGTNKIQHSIEETQMDSPYNTYRYAGLPPGPISNPSIESIQAALHPITSEYYYFVSNPDTGETLYGKTFEEHQINKQKAGL